MDLSKFPEVLEPQQFEYIFGLARGRAGKMVRAGILPGTILPDGTVRILRSTAQRFLDEARAPRVIPPSGGIPNI